MTMTANWDYSDLDLLAACRAAQNARLEWLQWKGQRLCVHGVMFGFKRHACAGGLPLYGRRSTFVDGQWLHEDGGH
jgi:hypothetical protein